MGPRTRYPSTTRAVSSSSTCDDESPPLSPKSFSKSNTRDRPAGKRPEGRRNAIDRGGHHSVQTASRDVELPADDSPPASPSAMDNLQAALKEAARRGLQDDRSPSPSPEPAPEAIRQRTVHTTPRLAPVLKLNYESPSIAEKGKWVAINSPPPAPSPSSDPAVAHRLAKYSIRARPSRMALLPPIDESLFDYARPHTRYRMCSMHTTKCNACLSKLKTGVLFECADCRMHLCQACVERRIIEMGEGGFDEHAPNHEGFVEAYLEWQDGGNLKEGFVAGNGVVFEMKVYKAKKVMVREGKGKTVPPKLDLRPPPVEGRERAIRSNHRGQVQSRAAPHPLTPYPHEAILPNDLGLPNEVGEPVPGVRGPSARGAATISAAAANDGAGRTRRPRRRCSSTYSSGSDSDSMDVLMDTAASIIRRTRPDGPAVAVAPAVSEESAGASVATEDAEAAAILVSIQRERECDWHRKDRVGAGDWLGL